MKKALLLCLLFVSATIAFSMEYNWQDVTSAEGMFKGMNAKIKYKMILMGSRMYQVGVLSDDNSFSLSDVDRFITSFQLLR